MKKAFTLIELMISVTILSVLMLFLYKSYAELNRQNRLYAQQAKKLHNSTQLRKVFYMDLLTAYKKTLVINKDEKAYDLVSFMTQNSLHRRINPYVTYIVKEKILYRLESRKQIKTKEIAEDIAFDVDKIGNISRLKLYASRKSKKGLYLLAIKFKREPQLLQKIKILN